MNTIELLKRYQVKKGDTIKLPTNTRIGDDKSGIYGGSYHIPDDDYNQFLSGYYRDTIAKNKNEYLTEKQRIDTGNGPILVDLDFKYPMDIKERQHSKEHIQDLVICYLDTIKEMLQLDSNAKIQVFVLEKPGINIVADKKLVKDGIHMIIGIQADHTFQTILREKVIPKIAEMWDDLPITNSWNDVFDEGISIGYTNWQMFGSRKPNHEAYQLTYIYEATYDTTDNEVCISPVQLKSFDIGKNIHLLSARYTGHPSFFMKNDFINVYNARSVKKSTSNASSSNTRTSQTLMDTELDLGDINALVPKISNETELDYLLNMFIDKINNHDYDLKEAYEYTMTLPENYYDEGSFTKWIRVGWVLKHISNKLLIVWIKFSSQAKNFKYTDIQDLCDKWRTFDGSKHQGLTKKSLMYWSKQDAYEKYKKVFEDSIDYFVENTINLPAGCNCGDFDIARVLYQYFKDRFVCTSVKSNIWYEYKNHRWMEVDSGTTLRKAISIELRELYNRKSNTTLCNMTTNINVPNMNNGNGQSNSNDDNDAENTYNKLRSQRLLDICQRLSKTNDKKNIMTEAKELFYDGTFINKLDTNPYLLCFKNGVIDFKDRVFRPGKPEDNISMCTNIEYRKLDEVRDKLIMEQCEDFMHKLFPNKELYDYMWNHLASTLIGTSSNQTFNMYIGIGQNGKSVLISLMEKVLGEYKGDVPLTLVTEGRTKIGGLSPEVVQLKGKRYAVMQEPSKGDKINEGIMKQLTSGIDPIQARAPYMLQAITFIPQLKLVVCSNTMMEIKSNDHGTWRRIRVVPYKSLFTENPVNDDPEKPYQFKIDKHIIEKFDDWKEVFASMLIERAFITNGVVQDCDMVMAASNEYRESQDYFAEFVRDCVAKDPKKKIGKSELNLTFTNWYKETYGGGCPSAKDLHNYMDKQFGRQKNQKWEGVRITIYDKERDDLNIPEDVDDDIDADDL
jgi:P4 family phage/plasmid primase-like protien